MDRIRYHTVPESRIAYLSCLSYSACKISNSPPVPSSASQTENPNMSTVPAPAATTPTRLTRYNLRAARCAQTPTIANTPKRLSLGCRRKKQRTGLSMTSSKAPEHREDAIPVSPESPTSNALTDTPAPVDESFSPETTQEMTTPTTTPAENTPPRRISMRPSLLGSTNSVRSRSPASMFYTQKKRPCMIARFQKLPDAIVYSMSRKWWCALPHQKVVYGPFLGKVTKTDDTAPRFLHFKKQWIRQYYDNQRKLNPVSLARKYEAYCTQSKLN